MSDLPMVATLSQQSGRFHLRFEWARKISLTGNRSALVFPHDIPMSQFAACMNFPGSTEKCSPYFLLP